MKCLSKIILTFFVAISAMLPQAFSRDSIISSDQAKQIAEGRFGGKALSATLLEKGDISVYRVKMINGGRVKIVTVPAKP